MKEKKIYKLAVVVIIIMIIIVALSVYVIRQKGKILKEEKTGQALATENINNEEEKKALTVNPESWDPTKVTAVTSKDGKVVPVPVGFTASKAEGEQEVDKGFVIYEGEVTAVDPDTWTEQEAWQASLEKNQFVWIPVENPSESLYEKNTTTGKIKARLWEYNASGRTEITNGSTSDLRYEPGILKRGSFESNVDDLRIFNNDKYSKHLQGYTTDKFYKELETEYQNTISSIEKYGGFFIGRYEIGELSQSVPVVRRMNSDIGNQDWYDMYTKIKRLSQNSNIQTSMIWGCLWDETLQWIVDTGSKTYSEIINSASWGNYSNSTFTYKESSGNEVTKNQNSAKIIPTGSTEYTKVNNIYDLAGNVAEWTLEGKTSEWNTGGRTPQKGRDTWQ